MEPEFTDLEIELIAALGPVLTERERCNRCGAWLRDTVEVVPGSAAGLAPPSWRLRLVARCGGWRRHRYALDVTPSLSGLRFGRFYGC